MTHSSTPRTTDNREVEARAMIPAASDGPAATCIFDSQNDPVGMFRELLSCGNGDVWAVWLPEHPRTVGEHPRPDHAVLACITGNGPTSEKNAEFFAWCLTNRDRILSALTPTPVCGEVEEPLAVRQAVGARMEALAAVRDGIRSVVRGKSYREREGAEMILLNKLLPALLSAIRPAVAPHAPYTHHDPTGDQWEICVSCGKDWPCACAEALDAETKGGGLDEQAIEAAALYDFRDYVRDNYHEGAVLSDPQWHAPKWFRAAIGVYQLARQRATRGLRAEAPAGVPPEKARGCATKILDDAQRVSSPAAGER